MGQPVQPRAGGPHLTHRYRVVVRGEFGDILSAAFSDVAITSGGGCSVLVATFRDSQELYGLIDRLRDHGVTIQEVTPVPEAEPTI